MSAARWKFNGQTTLKPYALQELVLGCRASGTACQHGSDILRDVVRHGGGLYHGRGEDG